MGVRAGSSGLRLTLACAAVLAGVPVVGAESSGIQPGKWIRVRASAEVQGEGFRLGPDTVRGELLAQDAHTATLKLNGQPTRIIKPARVIQGEVRSVDRSTFVIKGAGGDPAIIVPREAVVKLEVRQRESHKGRGVLIGILAGAAVGALIGVATSGEDGLGLDAESIGAAAGAVVGGPIGGVLGYVVAPGARWQDAQLKGDGAALPSGRGIRLGLTLRF